MKKFVKIAFIVLCTVKVYSQGVSNTEIDTLKRNISFLRSTNSYLKSEIIKLDSTLSEVNNRIDSLLNQTLKNSTVISQRADELDNKIKETGDKNDGKITEVSNSLSKNSLYGIIGVLTAILFSGLIYWLLNRRQQSDKKELDGKLENKTSSIKSDVFSELEKTKNELTQESARLDLQLLEVIEKQLKVADKLNAAEPTIDHTFHKNSANELQRIANYANSLDPESQEAVALQGSLGRLRNYFNSSDYEITDFTGKEYDERIPMRVRDTKYDESLPFGKEIIAKTWEPQIKYKGLVIQEAKIDKKYNN
jgi:hypothetical protein